MRKLRCVCAVLGVVEVADRASLQSGNCGEAERKYQQRHERFRQRERGLAPGPVVLDPAAADRMSSVKGLLPR